MRKSFALLGAILLLCLLVSCGKKETNGLQMSGSYYDNISDFAGTDIQESATVEDASAITKAYLQGVTYEIIELDKDNGVATLEVSVPNFTQLLPQIVTNVLAANEGASYEELLQIVQSEVEKALTDEGVEKTITTIDLPVEERNGEYKLIYNEQWDQIVFGSLEDMYIEYYRTMIGGLIDEIPE